MAYGEKIEREYHCPVCGELLAMNNYRTATYTPQEMEADWKALVDYKKRKHEPLCVATLEAHFKL